jgi:hypothetical protein
LEEPKDIQLLAKIFDGDPYFRLSLQRETVSGQRIFLLRLNHKAYDLASIHSYIKSASNDENALLYKFLLKNETGDYLVAFLIPNIYVNFESYCLIHRKEMCSDYLGWLHKIKSILRSQTALSAKLLYVHPKYKTLLYLPLPDFLGIKENFSAWIFPSSTPEQAGAYTAAAFLLYLFGIPDPQKCNLSVLPEALLPVIKDSLSVAENIRPSSLDNFIERIEATGAMFPKEPGIIDKTKRKLNLFSDWLNELRERLGEEHAHSKDDAF